MEIGNTVFPGLHYLIQIDYAWKGMCPRCNHSLCTTSCEQAASVACFSNFYMSTVFKNLIYIVKASSKWRTDIAYFDKVASE